LSFFWSADVYLGNTTYFTLMSFEIYRILLSPLVGNSLFTIIIVLMTYPNLGMKMESTMGSAQFLSLMGTISILTNVSFNVVCLLLYFMKSAEALFYNCCGFWTIVFGLITIECMWMPDGTRRLMFIPYDIPNKYFPLALYVLFSLFTGPRLDFALSIGIGMLYSKGYPDKLKLSSYLFEEAEAAGGLLHGISRNRGWVLAGAAIGHDAWIAVNSAEATGQNNAPRSQGAGASNNVYGIGSARSDPAPTQGSSGTIALPKDTFAGSGHKLATGQSSATVSREEMAARRLAALESGGGTH